MWELLKSEGVIQILCAVVPAFLATLLFLRLRKTKSYTYRKY